MIIGEGFRNLIGIQNISTDYLAQITGNFNNIYNYVYQPIAFLSTAPYFFYSMFPSDTTQDVMISFPVFIFNLLQEYLRLSQGAYNSIRDIPIQSILVSILPNYNPDRLAKFRNDIYVFIRSRGVTISDVVQVILNYYFRIYIVLVQQPM